MKLVTEKCVDQSNDKKPSNKIKDSIKNKEKGRISLPEEQVQEDKPNNEKLLKMPFSLNDIEDDVNSPFRRNITHGNEVSNQASLEIQMEPDDLYEVDEHNLSQDFDMSEGEFDMLNHIEKT